MRRIADVFLLLVAMAASTVLADDYLRIKVDSLPRGATSEIDFWVLRECPTPAFIAGAVNGFVITDNGSGMTWEWNQSPVQDPNSSINWNLGLGNWVNVGDGISPDSLVVYSEFGKGLASGMPIITEEEIYFDIKLTFADQEGEICIDSTFIFDAYVWKWAGMTCGGGDGTRPSFRDKYNNDGSPFCITITDCPVIQPNFTAVPDDDYIAWWPCGVTFDFESSCEGECTYVIAAGPGTIDPVTGVYLSQGLPEGIYDVTIEVIASKCYLPAVYSFQIEHLAPVLGDVDCSGSVDIDDVVYMLGYIFSGWPTPYYDPNCDGFKDIDDVIYLVDYIFGFGPPPCG